MFTALDSIKPGSFYYPGFLKPLPMISSTGRTTSFVHTVAPFSSPYSTVSIIYLSLIIIDIAEDLSGLVVGL